MNKNIILGFCLIIFLIIGCVSIPKTNIEVKSFLLETNKKRLVRRIAVLPFKSPLGHPTVGENVAEMLTTEMMSTGYFKVIERSELQKILEEQRLGLSGIIDDETAQQVGRILGVEGIVIGTVGEYGQKVAFGSFSSGMVSVVAISLRLICVETGEIIWSANVSGSSPKSRAELLTECVRKIGDDLAQKLRYKN